MSHQIIQQPDGRFCVFSTIVDDVVLTDATEEELIDYYIKKAEQEIRENISEITKDVREGNASNHYYQFAMTYDEMKETIAERKRLNES